MQAASALPTSPTAQQWQLEFAQTLPQLEQLAASQPAPLPLRVLRSTQLDAQRLDAELQTMLQEQFMAVFQLLPQGQVSSLEPELNLLLSALVWWLSVWRGQATPGSELMNLRYRNEHAMEQAAAAAAGAKAPCATGLLQQQPPPWLYGGRTGVEGPDLSMQQRCAYGIGLVALPYLWLRIHRYAANRGWGQRADDAVGQRCWRLLRGLDALHKVCSVVNLWVFLYQAKYRTLVERFICARLVYRQPSMSRLVSFEYLNRQLVWQELSEFLLFLLPLVNVTKVRRAVLRLLPKLPMLSSSSTGAGGVSSSMQYPKAEPQIDAAVAAASHSSSSVTADAAHSTQQMQGLDQAPEQTQQDTQNSSGSAGASSSSIAALLAPLGPCPICSASEILVPFVAHPCRHVFCYYCLQSHCAADSEFQCPVDGVRVDALQRYVRAVPVAPG